ncbi:DoxX family protein [Antrihabitans stalactiti]|uniref:DoxX family protein n=1 Tax=Antrihabitans stalactiti TaxID=2584121 RepID=A0A848K8J7_9NOCA|nr:DoxX family protein [Antrihabitans stalactiti]NMN95133.1 DoxX family protein [Antrihabitans stalactiti]
MLIRRIARPLLSTIFIAKGVDALRNTKLNADAARPMLEKSGVQADAETIIRANAAAQIAGGALLASGRVPRLASVVLAGTLLPGQLGQHAFWTETDPDRKAQERTEFLTGLSLLGGLMIASVDTEGKPSLGWRGRKAAAAAAAAVSAALPIGESSSDHAVGEKVSHGLHIAAERGRSLADVAQHRGAELADIARERGPVLAEAAKSKGAELADIARERGPVLADAAKTRGAELAEAARERAADLRDR